jgi:hypothetical protein
MEKVRPLYEYEPLILFRELKTSNEKEKKGIQMGQNHQVQK